MLTTHEAHPRSLSLLTPSGHLTLGNLLGALRPMARDAGPESFYGLSDLHAMTVAHDPALLRQRSSEMATLLLAAGLAGEGLAGEGLAGERTGGATLFRQSRVPAHTALAYLLECTARTGELSRMIQYKEKGRGVDSTRVSLYTYPVLMAADILLYRPTVVPVGDDQRQHVELARDLAQRFNASYGEVFVVPRVATAASGARVMDLLDPTRKMSKSAGAAGSIYLLDPPEVVRRKISRALTDSETGPEAVRADRATKPGVTNLLEILTACGGSAAGITTYGALKRSVTEAVIATLEPIQTRYAGLAADRVFVTEVLRAGEERCRAVTEPVLATAAAAMGL